MINRLKTPRRNSEVAKLAFKAYEMYKADGFYKDQNNLVYDFLDEQLLIPFTAQEKLEILLEARKKIDKDIQKRNQQRRNVSCSQAIQLNEHQHRDGPESKLIALQRYFRLLQKEGSTLPLKCLTYINSN